MKNQWLQRLLSVTCGVLLFTSCSSSTDGGVPIIPDVVVKPAPVITLFAVEAVDAAAPADAAPDTTPDAVPVNQVTKAAASAGSSAAVAAGGTIKLRWQVTDAATVRLSASRDAFATAEVAASGEQIVTNVRTDEEYTLVAIGDGGRVEKQVSVTVSAPTATLQINDFSVDGKTTVNVQQGADVTLCYAVQPKNAVVTVKDADTGAVITADSATPAPATTEPLTETALSPTPDTPAVGALFAVSKLSLSALPRAAETSAEPTVAPTMPTTSPTETPIVPEQPVDESQVQRGCVTAKAVGVGEHHFVATATLDNQTVTSQTVTVVAASALQVLSFTANGKTEVTLDKAGEVRLAWEVTPETAAIQLEPAVCITTPADGEAPLAEGECSVLQARDVVTVTIDKTTTYTLTATDANGQTATAQVTITVQAPVVKVLTLSVNTASVFAGESVTFTVAGDTEQVELVSPSGQRIPVQPGDYPMVVTESGAYQAVASGSDVPVMSNAVTVNVRSWSAPQSGGATWTAVALNPGNPAGIVAGRQGKPGVLELAQGSDSGAWGSSTVNFTELMSNGVGTGLKEAGLQKFGTLPINGFAFDAAVDSGKRVYAAAAGMGLVSKNAGATWSLFEVFPMYSNGSSSPGGSLTRYMSCDGREQVGAEDVNTHFVNIIQACDVLVSQNRIFFATDHGVYYLDDPDAFLANQDRKKWHGGTRDGTLDAATNLQNVLTHELANVESTIYAATNNGVYRNAQNGENNNWSPAGLQGAAVYAITATEDGANLYAGTADGKIVRLGDASGNEWETIHTFDGPVYSVAVNRAEGVLLAGTSSGVHLLRLNAAEGNYWVDISTSMQLGDKKSVYSVAIGNDGKISRYAAATDNGVYSSLVTTVVTPPAPIPTPEPPVVTKPTLAGNAGTVGAASVMGDIF